MAGYFYSHISTKFIAIIVMQVYPYLVVNDSSVSESRREERLLQLLRMMNMFLEKQKVNNTMLLFICCLFMRGLQETCRRHLMFTVPRVVAVSPQMRLVEVNKYTSWLCSLIVCVYWYSFVSSSKLLQHLIVTLGQPI